VDFDGGLDTLLTALRTTLVGALEVAEQCLQFATLASAETPGYTFNSSHYRGLDVKPEIDRAIPGSISSQLSPRMLSDAASAIERSSNPPLASWYLAFKIARSMSQDFSAHLVNERGESVFTLNDLDAFCVPAEACTALYGQRSFSERADVDRSPFEPSQVPGLSLWKTDTHLPFSVVVDTEGGAQFSASLGDHGDVLAITLIQPNDSIAEIFIDEFAPAVEPDRRFFGVRPLDPTKQLQTISESLSRAVGIPTGIVLLPELVNTASLARSIADQVMAMTGDSAGAVLPRVVVGGSYHHIEDGVRRNTTLVHFPSRTGPPVADRVYSKSAAFFMDFPPEILEYLTGTKGEYTGDLHFREDVEPSTEIRLYIGDAFSAVVVICSDLLDKTFLNAIHRLKPSLVLVCNMTYKSEGFVSIAHDLIAHSQTTTVMVNNPGEWWNGKSGAPKPDPPDGIIIGMPLAGNRILQHNFESDERIAQFSTRGAPASPQLSTYKI